MDINRSNLNQRELVCKIYGIEGEHCFSLKTILVQFGGSMCRYYIS